MTVAEYLQSRKPFYHITPDSNVESILQKGLLREHDGKRNSYGICTVRSVPEFYDMNGGKVDDVNMEDIFIYIAIAQLQGDGKNFSVFKLPPRYHDLRVCDILKDRTEDYTNDIHNYIRQERLIVCKEDIIYRFSLDEIPKQEDFRQKIESRIRFEQLTEYCPDPNDSTDEDRAKFPSY
jgi:hypothetical protein